MMKYHCFLRLGVANGTSVFLKVFSITSIELLDKIHSSYISDIKKASHENSSVLGRLFKFIGPYIYGNAYKTHNRIF